MVSLGLTTLGMLALYHLFPTLRARHAHGHRISLSKNGLELTRIDGHTDMIPWKAHPYLKEIRQGYAIIALKGQEDLHYPIDYLPMSMHQLERLLSTFSTDGRLRARLSGPEAPQHRPRRPGTHRGRTDRRLLDLGPLDSTYANARMTAMSILTGKATQPIITPERSRQEPVSGTSILRSDRCGRSHVQHPHVSHRKHHHSTGHHLPRCLHRQLRSFILVSQVLPFSRPNILESRQPSKSS